MRCIGYWLRLELPKDGPRFAASFAGVKVKRWRSQGTDVGEKKVKLSQSKEQFSCFNPRQADQDGGASGYRSEQQDLCRQ